MPSKIGEVIANYERHHPLGNILLLGTAGIDLEPLLKSAAAKVVAIEPNEALWSRLDAPQGTRFELWKAGIAATEGQAPFYSYNFPQLSSLRPPSDALQRLFPGMRQTGVQTIQTFTLSSILEELPPSKEDPNVVVVNAPGAERQILEEVLSSRWRGYFSLLLLRCAREPLYAGSLPYEGAVARLEAEGFRLESRDEQDPEFPVAVLRFEPLILEVKQLRAQLQAQACSGKANEDQEQKILPAPHLARGGCMPPRRKPNRLRHAADDHGRLAENKAFSFAQRHALCHYGSGALYSFIPKNACTSMRYSLALANGAISGPVDFAWIHQNNNTFCASLREVVTAPYSFVILRCPYARVASVFLDKIVDQKDVIRSFEANGLGRDGLDRLTFRGFVEMLKSPLFLKHNHHWAPQVSFLILEEYSDVFRLERFAEAAKRIEARTGMEIHDTRSLSGHGTEGFESLCDSYGDVPAAEIRALKLDGKIPSHASLYDGGLLAAVSKVYDADIELYRAHFGEASLEANSPVLSTASSS